MFQQRVRILALMVMLTPAVAQADWLFTPLLGPTFGADTFGEEHIAYGAAFVGATQRRPGWKSKC